MESRTGELEVAGAVLAAGASRRMGQPKALLDAGGLTFLAACIGALREGGCARVVVVVPPSEPDVRREAERLGGTVVDGLGPDSEQVDSLRRALEPLDTVAAVAVLPVDHPLVEAGTVRALIDAWRGEPGAVARPILDGRPGHPTIFPRTLWAAFGDPDLDQGARSVVEDPRTQRLDLVVDDPGVVADIDTPSLYRRLVEDR